MKRGMAEVLKDGACMHQFKEGDYFGEIALLSDQARRASLAHAPQCSTVMSCEPTHPVLAAQFTRSIQ